MFKKFSVFILIIVVLFVFSSCSKKTQSDQSTNNTNTQSDTVKEQPTSTITPTTAAPEKQTKSVKLPDGFPSDFFPILENASGSCFDIGGTYVLNITTTSTTDEIINFYTKAFSKYGDKFIVSGDKRVIKVEGDGKSAEIIIDNIPEGRALRISVKK